MSFSKTITLLEGHCSVYQKSNWAQTNFFVFNYSESLLGSRVMGERKKIGPSSFILWNVWIDAVVNYY